MRRLRVAVAATLCALGCLASPAVAGQREAARTAGLPSTAVDYQLDAAHDGHGHDPSFEPPLTKAWSDAFGTQDRVISPLVVGDLVFVGFDDPDGGPAQLEALSLDTGQLVWGPVAHEDNNFLGFAYDRGKLFDLAADGDLTAYDAATGVVDWSTTLEGDGGFFFMPPTAADGVLYLSQEGGRAPLFALDESDGSVLWQAPAESSGVPSVDSTGVYLNSGCRYTRRYSLAGSLVWQRTMPCPAGEAALAPLHAGSLWAHDVERSMAEPGAVFGEATGALDAGILSATPPAFDQSTMVGVVNGRLEATNITSGIQQWATPERDYTLPPIIVNGYVVGADLSGHVRLLDEQSGRKAWSDRVEGTIEPVDEYGVFEPAGLAEGSGILVVPSTGELTAYRSAASPAPRVRITSGPGTDTFTKGSAAWHFTADAAGQLTCTLDGVSTGCTSPYSATGLAPGWHTFTVALAGQPAASDSRLFAVDETKPSVHLGNPRPSAQAFEDTVHWSGTDADSAIAGFDVRERLVTQGSPVPAWQRPPRLQHTIVDRTRLAPQRKAKACISLRSIDLGGNRSAWSPTKCAELS